jgi:hypothetical protein
MDSIDDIPCEEGTWIKNVRRHIADE